MIIGIIYFFCFLGVALFIEWSDWVDRKRHADFIKRLREKLEPAE
jgi:hypothetical protein